MDQRMVEAWHRGAGWGSVAAVGLALTGCGSLQTVPVRDDDSPVYAVRATARPGSPSGGAKGGAGVEVGYESYRARDTQTLAAGQFISLDGGGTVNGPDTLNHEAKVQQFHVGYNHRMLFGENFQLESLLGVTQLHLRMESQSAVGTSVPRLSDRKTGAIFGITPRWRFNETVAVEARLSYSIVGAWGHGQSYEAALVLNPMPEVAVRLGYSERRYDIEPTIPGWYSEVNLRARGPMATLQFDF